LGCPTHRVVCDVWVWTRTECVEIAVTLRRPIYLALVTEILPPSTSGLAHAAPTHPQKKRGCVGHPSDYLGHPPAHFSKPTRSGAPAFLLRLDNIKYQASLRHHSRCGPPAWGSVEHFRVCLPGYRTDIRQVSPGNSVWTTSNTKLLFVINSRCGPPAANRVARDDNRFTVRTSLHPLCALAVLRISLNMSATSVIALSGLMNRPIEEP
jgi:hypothetical protein